MRSSRSLFRSAAFTLAAAAITLPSHAAWTNLDWFDIERQTQPVVAQDAPPGDDLPRLSADELDELLGPIALYPDVLLSAVLAASVYPDQVAAAAVLVRNGSTGEQLEGQGWEDPVVAVAKVPEVITLMGQYPEWTRALGSAFLIQSWDVMDSIQRLRGIAFENGALQTTPQQIITVEQQTQKIIIAPANPTVIFVPQYNPSVVFVRDNRSVATAGVIGFGAGVAVGAIIWGGSSNWNGGFVSWGRGGWWGWNNNSNNRTNINVDNSRNTNININRPGGNTNNVGINRLPDRIGNEGNRWTPDRNRPGVGGSATGPGSNNINRDRINDWRDNRPNSRPPGSSNVVPPSTNRPGLGDNRPNLGGNRPGGGVGGAGVGGGLNRPTPTPPAGNRPPINRPGVGGGAAGGGTNRPSIERPTTLPARPTTPTTRPGVGGGTGAGGTRAPGAVQRPTTLPARPAGTPTTGNRTSAFSGGPGNAAANRGAASRAAATNRPAAATARPAAAGAARGGGGGGGGRGGR